MDLLKDLLAAVGVIINGLPQGILALSFGFAAMPTAVAFIIGAVGSGVMGLVAPISFQAETITLAGTMGSNLKERLSMIFYGGLIMALIGLFGMLQAIVEFIGPVITNGMMAGVGIMLSMVAVNMAKKNKIVGLTSIASAFAVREKGGLDR
jgi:AGZA family xanthine/uracil permease-like MFS transporter